MTSPELAAVQQAIFLNEWEKLDAMMCDAKYAPLLLRRFSTAHNYKGIDGDIGRSILPLLLVTSSLPVACPTLMHYAVYCDAFDCAEVLLKYGGKTLRDKPASSGNLPRDVSNRIFLENFTDLFDQFRPPRGFVEPIDDELVAAPPAQQQALYRPVNPSTSGDSPRSNPATAALTASSQHRMRVSVGTQRLSTNRTQATSSQPQNDPVTQSPSPTTTSENSTNPFKAFAASTTPPLATGSGRTTPQRVNSSSSVPVDPLMEPEVDEPVPERLMALFTHLRNDSKFSDVTISAFQHSERAHSYVLALRCPKLAESPDFCKAASQEAVHALVDFIYSDQRPAFGGISVPGVFELWGMSLDLQVPRLEAFIRLWLRNNVTLENAVELAQCMNDFNLLAEYLAVLRFVKLNSTALKPTLMQHRQLALNILRANEADYPQAAIHMPPTSLSSDLLALRSIEGDLTLFVTGCQGQQEMLDVHKAILTYESSFWAQHSDLASGSTSIDHTSDATSTGFSALVDFFYSDALIVSVADAFHLFLAVPVYKLRQETRVKELLRKRLTNLNANEAKEIEGVLSALPSAKLSALSRSELFRILPKALTASIAQGMEEQARFDRMLAKSEVVQDLKAQVAQLTAKVAALEAKLRDKQ